MRGIILEDFIGHNLKCPECGVISPADKWVKVDPYCELCGSHYGVQCPNPNCHGVLDLSIDHDLNKMEAAAHVDPPDPDVTK